MPRLDKQISPDQRVRVGGLDKGVVCGGLSLRLKLGGLVQVPDAGAPAEVVETLGAECQGAIDLDANEGV